MDREPWVAARDATMRIAARLARVLAPPAKAYEPWIVGGHVVGWIIPERVQRLLEWDDVFRRSARGIELAPRLVAEADRTAALDAVARKLSAEGALTTWRDERYAVAAARDAPLLLALERAAARYFGIHTHAAHANGLVARDGAWRMWLARRSPTKPIDPGLLDNLVGGGMPVGADARTTLVKEAFEEAGIPGELARQARSVGTLDICRDQPEGLQRETIHVHDLELPEEFVPRNQDGEAVELRLHTPEAVLEILRGDDITADASLVIVDYLLRHDHIDRADPSRAPLAALRHRVVVPNGRAARGT
jgi:8-oxo-dGTP pyrophosphatase MutT (NUDIX family)